MQIKIKQIFLSLLLVSNCAANEETQSPIQEYTNQLAKEFEYLNKHEDEAGLLKLEAFKKAKGDLYKANALKIAPRVLAIFYSLAALCLNPDDLEYALLLSLASYSAITAVVISLSALSQKRSSFLLSAASGLTFWGLETCLIPLVTIPVGMALSGSFNSYQKKTLAITYGIFTLNWGLYLIGMCLRIEDALTISNQEQIWANFKDKHNIRLTQKEIDFYVQLSGKNLDENSLKNEIFNFAEKHYGSFDGSYGEEI